MPRKTVSDNAASIDELQAQVQALKSDISVLTQTLSEYSEHEAQSLKDAAVRNGATLRARGEEALGQARESAITFASDAESKLRENPATSVAIATGVGFLVGMATARR